MLQPASPAAYPAIRNAGRWGLAAFSRVDGATAVIVSRLTVGRTTPLGSCPGVSGTLPITRQENHHPLTAPGRRGATSCHILSREPAGCPGPMDPAESPARSPQAVQHLTGLREH